MKLKDIYWLEEIGQEYNEQVGKKSANLGEMLKVGGIQVPSGFAISISAYENFAKEAGIAQEIVKYLKKTFPEGVKFTDLKQLQEASSGIRVIIESKKVPQYLREEIGAYYNNLCDKYGVTDLPVSIRSAGAKSHPGQYETYLNVSSIDRVVDKVLKVWSSIFNAKSISATLRQSVEIENCPPIGVCVLKMVNARTAGVCVTVNPNTGDETEALVESNWGLGESVVSGAATPDSFIVDKGKMMIKKRVTGKKEKQVIMKDQDICEETISPDKQDKSSLSEEEVIKIVDLAMKLELHFGVPQDIEFAVDSNPSAGDNIVLLQTRPQVGIPKKKNETDKFFNMPGMYRF